MAFGPPGSTGKGEYASAAAGKHKTSLLVHEVSGAMSPGTRATLKKHCNKLDPDDLVAHGAVLTWSNATSPLAYYSQRASIALHDHVACELLKSTHNFPRIRPYRYR